MVKWGVHTKYFCDILGILRKSTVIFELQAKLSTFIKHHFYLVTEQLTDKLCLFGFEYLADSFLKMTEVSLLL